MPEKSYWIVSHDGTSKTPYRMECQRCGEFEDLKVPLAMSEYLKIAQAFIEKHKDCEEGDRCNVGKD